MSEMAAPTVDHLRALTDHYGETTPANGMSHEFIVECAACWEDHQEWLGDTNEDPDHDCAQCIHWLGEINSMREGN